LRNGKLSMVVSDMKTVNGLAFSPDEKYLYVNGGSDNYIRRYDIQPDGTLTNPKLIIDLSNDKTPGVTDGTKIDSKGNIWTTGPGGVWIISPEGKHLGSILMAERPANLGFGDADLKTLYLTARSSVYKVRVNTPGVPCPACPRLAGTN
jgi:gluconolactonase